MLHAFGTQRVMEVPRGFWLDLLSHCSFLACYLDPKVPHKLETRAQTNASGSIYIYIYTGKHTLQCSKLLQIVQYFESLCILYIYIPVFHFRHRSCLSLHRSQVPPGGDLDQDENGFLPTHAASNAHEECPEAKPSSETAWLSLRALNPWAEEVEEAGRTELHGNHIVLVSMNPSVCKVPASWNSHLQALLGNNNPSQGPPGQGQVAASYKAKSQNSGCSRLVVLAMAPSEKACTRMVLACSCSPRMPLSITHTKILCI